jgi:hypothetical protein
MALVQKQITSKRQTILTLIMIAVITTTGLVVYFGYFRGSATGDAPAGSPETEISNILKVQPKSKNSLELLESLTALPAWQRMKKFGRYPLLLTPYGNPEPFKLPAAPPAQ